MTMRSPSAAWYTMVPFVEVGGFVVSGAVVDAGLASVRSEVSTVESLTSFQLYLYDAVAARSCRFASTSRAGP